MEIFEGIILKKINYKEHSKIIYLYTENGLVSVLIHGSNKISSPYLKFAELLSYVRFNASGKNLKTLKDGEILEDYRNIKADIVKYTYSTHILELIYYFANHEHDHAKLYNFLLKILNKISESIDYIPYVYMVEAKLLYLLGINPEFSKCIECGKTEDLIFSITAGGMICPEHFHGEETFDLKTVKTLEFLYYYDLQNPVDFKLDEQVIKNIRLLLDKYYEYHLNYRSKSRKILNGLIGY